ncbi:MAG: hypothetical protein ACR2PA_13885 [Hyphomicrobiaceae bacterium]
MLSAVFIAATPVSAGQSGSDVIESARKSCYDLENGQLSTTDNAISRIDLTGNGQLDEIVDSCQFTCSTAASLFQGTGGCLVSIVANKKVTEFIAKGWKVVTWGKQPILLLAVHGSECGGTNLRRCYRAVVWSDGGFQTTNEKPR